MHVWLFNICQYNKQFIKLHRYYLAMDKKYKVLSKISEGKFGEVYNGVFERNQEKVAIKMEFLDTPLKTLSQEGKLLNYLSGKGSYYTPNVYWFGKYGNRQALVLSLYEYTFDKWYEQNPELSKIKLPTMMAKMVNILQTVHNAGVIHRDIKPQNFMIRNDTPYLIDFGLATIYIDEHGKHLPQKGVDTHILGTPKFVSMHIHVGIDGIRRDDLLSLCYVYTYITNNCHIFWDSVQEDTYNSHTYDIGHILHPNNQQILTKKNMFHNTSHELTQIDSLYEYLYNLNYSDTPHYQMIQDTFLTISSNKLGL